MNLLCLLLALVISGCASTSDPIIISTYPQSEHTNDFVLVKPTASIVISSIDGTPYSISPSSGLGKNYEIKFLPGKHTLKIDYYNGIRSSTSSQALKIDLKPNKKYIIRAVTYGGGWEPVLVDVTEKPECWSIGVGTYFGPKDCL